MIRIGIDARELFAPYVTGIGRYTANLINSLVRSRDFRVIAYGVKGRTRKLEIDRRADLRLLSARGGLVVDHVALTKAAERDRLDVFYSPFPKIPLLYRGKTINTIHDLIYYRIQGYRASKPIYYRPLFIILLKLWTKHATRVAAVSVTTKQDIVDILRVPEAKIDIVPNTIATPAIQGLIRDQAKAVPRNSDADVQDESFILYVGNFLPHKNVAIVIRGFCLAARFAEMKLYLVGPEDRWKRRVLEKVDPEMGDRVIALSDVTDADLDRMLQRAIAVVVPSLYEGFGLPVLEAMGRGTAVICTRQGALSEVAGGVALHFEPQDAGRLADLILDLAIDRAKSRVVGDLGKLRAEAFAPDNVSLHARVCIERALGA